MSSFQPDPCPESVPVYQNIHGLLASDIKNQRGQVIAGNLSEKALLPHLGVILSKSMLAISVNIPSIIFTKQRRVGKKRAFSDSLLAITCPP
jgi:hypothetical protein